MTQSAVQFSTHNCASSKPLEEYALKKLETVSRHFNKILDVKFTFDVLGERRHRASVTCHVPGKPLHADFTAEDMYVAIDRVVDKLDHLVCVHKDKMRSH